MSDTNPLYSGMLWLRRADDKIEVAVGEAIRYAEEKYGRPVHLVMRIPHACGGEPRKTKRSCL